MYGSYVPCCKFALGPVKRATYTDFAAKGRTSLCFLQQLFATSTNLICCKTGLIRLRKNAKHSCSTLFAAMLRNKLHVFAARFNVP